jgi:hypothetical protein
VERVEIGNANQRHGRFEDVDGSTSYSEEKNGRAATFSGNAQLDNAEKKFGSSSIEFDGTGDLITFVDNADWDLSSLFQAGLPQALEKMLHRTSRVGHPLLDPRN